MNARHGTHILLGAITPAYHTVDADELLYPNLAQARETYGLTSLLKPSNLPFRKNYFESAKLREDLRAAYLLTTAYRLQKAWTPTSKIFWSKQFTMTSVQLFGRPMSGEVAKLAHDELRYFEKVAARFPSQKEFFEPILTAYGSLVTQRLEIHPSLEIRHWKLLRDMRAVFYKQYGEVLACFDDIPSGTVLEPQQVMARFAQALNVLKKMDSSWERWRVVHDSSAKLCVNLYRRVVIIGRRRAPIPAEEVRGLFAHEVLIHAKRSIEGRKKNQDLAYGLPGYTAAEEGLGVLVESAVNGRFSPKVKDRYIDIALALGSGRRRPLSRAELFTFCYSRAVIRSIESDPNTSLEQIEKAVWEHVNRIYRGSLGNHYVGVFTKDVTYYKGFVKIAKYLERRQKTIGLEKAINYLMQGKFDPTIKTHRQRIRSSKNQ